MVHSHTIETYGRAPHNRNIWQTGRRHAWPILLSAFQVPFIPLLVTIASFYFCVTLIDSLWPIYLKLFHNKLLKFSTTSLVHGVIVMPISTSLFFSSVGCADDEALTRLFQTFFLFVFGRFTSPGSFWIFFSFRSSLTLSVQIRHVRVSWSLARQ